ncbi:MAG: xylose isomerase [Candidatus Handelsmanbacteria bacterium RIFCSPLOWO2_12_FULL_64_10]|uniref:Xylose isomerase n=1 Tax=Handelsmanbacteria sp. (strain RIFCSPLOWO2_12_FULL_64_10) TaxID=1817868 RepID=A0A1F6C9W6_HANXR|nr:MAG: xylose isomerase [Candidatus Handelsmanbacteria bacterium RIFCSPLOWO2_12_FULL_64_10]
MRLGVSSYSFWHFRGEKVPIEEVIRRARQMGLDGVEILHRQMASEEDAYLAGLKRESLVQGMDLYSLSIHQDFVHPDPDERARQVDHTKRCIEVAYRLGIPAIRMNSGRWKTIPKFDDLMAAGGIEPPLPGRTDEEAFAWVIESIRKCLPLAEARGVVLALENHWGLTFAPEGVLRIVEAIPSPWLGVTMDTGNFLGEPYDKLRLLTPHAVLVHAKTYFGGGEWYTLDLDYRRIAAILREGNYSGYVSIEFEGKEDAMTGVPQSAELIRSAFEAERP